MTIDDVLERVNTSLDAQGLGRATKGVIFSIYPGGKSEMLREGLAKYLGPDTGDAAEFVAEARARLDAGDPPSEIFGRLAQRDLDAMASRPGWLRLSLAHHARVEDDVAAAALTRVYEAFDEVYLDLYAELLRRQGRELKPQYTIKDLALALSALSEGLALRLNGDSTLTDDARQRVIDDIAAQGRSGIVETMTTPAPGTSATTSS